MTLGYVKAFTNKTYLDTYRDWAFAVESGRFSEV